MVGKFLFLVSSIVLLINLSGCAGASITDTRVSSKQARIIFEVPKDVDIDKITKSLYEAISYRVSDLSENEGLLPEKLPEKPGYPQNTSLGNLAVMAGNNITLKMMQLDMSNSYYYVSGQGSMSTAFNDQLEYYKAAVYPYKDGYKIYIYLFYQEGVDGILGSLTDMAVKSIVGQDGALLYMAQIRDKFKNLVPEAKITSQSPRKLEKIVLNDIGWVKEK